MEESSLDPQHSPGRTDFNFDFSIDKIRCDVDNQTFLILLVKMIM